MKVWRFVVIVLLQIYFSLTAYSFDGMTDSLAQLSSKYYSEGLYSKTIDLIHQNDSLSLPSKIYFYGGMSSAALYNFQQSKFFFQKAIEKDSMNAQWRYQFGCMLKQAGLYDEAIPQLETCFRLDSTYLPAYFQLGIVYNLKRKNENKEAEIFSFLVQKNQKDFLSLFYLGDALKRMEHSDSGIIFIQRSYALNRQFFPSVIALANYDNSKKDFPTARKYYQQALALKPVNEDVTFQIGECYRRMGELDSAVAYFRRALALDSLNAIYHAQLGYAYFSQENYDSSIAEYNTAIVLDSTTVQYCLNLAHVFEKVDSVQGAEQAYERAIQELQPIAISHVYNNLAAFYFTKRLWRKASEAYQHVLEFNPENKAALRFLAMTYERIPDFRSAIQAYEKYLEITKVDTARFSDYQMIKRDIEQLRQELRKSKPQ
ncbi:MAG: tetratricopeptide repeat protein [Bacteroidota bacterium]|nr:tetratricopeptide repeat protein [Bacteroidota bacterium]